jgi:antitoxin component YwqK of YwqJK toxin-antitoxin module
MATRVDLEVSLSMLRQIRFTLILAALAAGTQARIGHGQDPASSTKSDAIYLEEPTAFPPPVVVQSGPLEDKYEDGKVRIRREVRKMSDDTLVNHGAFLEFYPNGQKFVEGAYESGVHHGTWTYWHDNGQICKSIVFKQGRADGAWEVYRADGTLQAKKSYKDNKRDGLWVTYHDDGKTPLAEETYVNGVREGLSRAYFANGKTQREVIYKNNLPDGLFTEWDESGRKVAEVEFKDGKKHGRFVMYRADGRVIEQQYEDGRLLSAPTGN